MNDDILPSLLKEVQDKFETAYGKSDIINSAFAKLKNKKATYATANDFAIEIGDMLAEALNSSVTGDKLPDGRMYYNIAKRLLDETLGRNFEIVRDFTGQVQANLNKEANIGLQVQIPEFNQDRVAGLVNRLSSEDDFEKVSWLLQEPIVNFTQSIVDDSIRANAEFHGKAGLRPQIIRKDGGKCCDWCRKVVGTYDYPRVPKDVYRRHKRCRCTVDYDPKNGKVRDVWSKIWRKKEREQESAKRISNAVFNEGVSGIRKDIARLDMTRAKPNDIIELGKRINYHFKVSEHLGDKEKLKEIFSNFRDIGGVVPKSSWAKGSSRIVKSQLEEAFSLYPKEWALIPQDNGLFLQAKKTKRGYFSKSYHPDDPIIISTNGKKVSTPFHEIGHMIEAYNPDVLRIEKEWVKQRTAGESSVKLKDIFPISGYSSTELTKKDDFIDPYIGKDYRDATEVLSMGLQGIFTPEELFTKSYDSKTWKYERKTINDDPEFLNLIIGLYLKA